MIAISGSFPRAITWMLIAKNTINIAILPSFEGISLKNSAPKMIYIKGFIKYPKLASKILLEFTA